MAKTVSVWDLGSSADPPGHAYPPKMVGGKCLLRSSRDGHDGFSKRWGRDRFQQPPRTRRAALVQICVGVVDRNPHRRFVGVVKPEVGRKESFRAQKPRHQI